jgi:opacity protein-like surface antigen
MPIRRAIAVAGLLLAALPLSVSAQRSGDRARLVFTVSGAYIAGRGLWTVPNQQLEVDGVENTLVLGRNIQNTFGAAVGATYHPGETFGLNAEAFLIGLGYDDACRVTSGGGDRIAQVCDNIDEQEKSAAAVAVSVGGVVRVASREFISPFARASVGLLLMNQSSVLMQGQSNSGALLTIYEDDTRTRIRPSLTLGVGATMVMSRGYHLRWEVRDNIVGVERVTGPVALVTQIPPHETTYKHLFSVLIGIDVILERQRGRRY